MVSRLVHTEIRDTPCPNCKAYSFPIDLQSMLEFFQGQKKKCPKCNTDHDWWDLLERHFDWGFPSYLFALVGGTTTSFMVDMEPNKVFKIDLTKVGIPVDAKVLHINYTAAGDGLFPLEIHGNTPIRHSIPTQFYLYGRPHGNPQATTPVAVQVIWVSPSINDEAWDSLVEAIESFSSKNFLRAILPSNVAVESILSKLIFEYLSKYASNDRVERFLTDAATYSYQLNILLVIIANHSGFPILPDIIRGNLNKLRNIRNDIAHRGNTVPALNEKTTSSLICSAIFGLSYLLLLKQHLSNKGII